MRLEKHNADEMTPLERIYAYEHGLSYDRIPSVPFIGNVRCKVGGMTPEEYETENRYLSKNFYKQKDGNYMPLWMQEENMKE